MTGLAFLLYDNRSGSTLLSALLSEFEGVAVSHETDLVAAVLESPGRRGLVETRGLVAHLYGTTRFPELGLDRDRVTAALLANGAAQSRQAALRTLVGHYFETHGAGAEAWVLKGPRLHYHLDALAGAFPDATVLHLVRDGRAVFRSKRTTPSGHALRTGEAEVMDDDILRAAHNWQRKLALTESFTGLPVHTVRYEDLLAEPDAQLSRVLGALGVAEAGRVRSGSRAAFVDAQIGGTYHRLHQNVSGALDAAKASRWQRELSPSEVEAYEALAGDALARYGYARTALDGTPRNVMLHRLSLYRLRLKREVGRLVAVRKAMQRGDAVRLLRSKVFEWRARRASA